MVKFLVTVIAAPRGCEGTVRDTVEVESYSYEQAQWDAIRKFREKHPRHDFATFETWESRIQPETQGAMAAMTRNGQSVCLDEREAARKPPRMQPYTQRWQSMADELARVFAPTIKPCCDCGGPVAKGYCCTRCGSRNP